MRQLLHINSSVVSGSPHFLQTGSKMASASTACWVPLQIENPSLASLNTASINSILVWNSGPSEHRHRMLSNNSLHFSISDFMYHPTWWSAGVLFTLRWIGLLTASYVEISFPWKFLIKTIACFGLPCPNESDFYGPIFYSTHKHPGSDEAKMPARLLCRCGSFYPSIAGALRSFESSYYLPRL